MDDNKPGADTGETAADSGPLPPGGRRKRPAPTIDLEASEVSDVSDASHTAGNPDAEQAQDAAADPDAGNKPSRSWAVPIGVSALAGALATALIFAVALWAEWPFVSNDGGVAERKEAAILATLNARVARIESKASEPAAPQAAVTDPALADKLTSVETALASLRDDVTALRAQADKASADVSAVKSAPAESAPVADFSAIEERLGKIERATAALAAAPPPSPPAAPAPDPRLQQVAAASSLDQAVRNGAPFATQLAAAAKLAGGTDALKPLAPFAASGIPAAGALSRELLTLLPQLEPKQVDAPASGGILDRLQQSAMKLVRVRRVDAPGSDVSAVIARAKAAAQRDDVAAASRELSALPAADRAAVQSWLDKVAARDAALAASQKFVADTMAVLPGSPVLATPR
ncbi:hypothetical protein ASC80_19130 [Afipia sp. Root123D2]|uniref:COG4223 family protein n=1 Tax=Afipia sp. Root123D2 TaxID=1736436 RepID=UPI0006FF235E|nr:hypothetical protein [Afipia sp. Root123D2]KQW19480.1 hypothetical protein ASC80_19130 [Afipia sp. Root123D2]